MFIILVDVKVLVIVALLAVILVAFTLPNSKSVGISKIFVIPKVATEFETALSNLVLVGKSGSIESSKPIVRCFLFPVPEFLFSHIDILCK